MNVKELKSIMTEYEKVKIIPYQNGGTEDKAMICYEKEIKVQRAITKIKRYKR